MKKQLILAVALTAIVPSLWAVQYNQTITAIFGSGNPDSGWTTDTASGVTLGLRAKNRTTGSTVNASGVYSFATAPATRGLWNYEFSINSGTATLAQSGLTFWLSADTDSSMGVSYSTISPLTYWADNSYGNAGTGQGLGVEGTFAALGGANTIAQNSQNITFGDYPGGALALEQNATYDYLLFAKDVTGATVASVDIQVVVGNGGSRVPDAGSTSILLGTGLVGLAGLRRKFGV